MKKSWRKPLFTTIKILVSLGLLYFVFTKIDWDLLAEEWRIANKFLLFVGFISFLISQVLSVLRVDLYFKKAEIQLSFINNLRLYLLGMFYNFFIPGGVGGDAYKVIALNKHFDQPVKTITSAVFFDRFIGLCAICILICLGIVFIPLDIEFWIKAVIFSIGLIGALVGPYILGLLFPRFKSVFYPTLLYSFVIQAFQIGTIVFSLLAIHPEANIFTYILIFLVSSVLSVVSFAGIGIRETVFYYSASYLNFNPDVSAGVALMFSFITLVTSLFGAIYLFKRIKF
ncbi:flippase-like domain-containing protein [Weeksellaceae bacterium KMM 9724]|uniref:lysylphosphatidylglycerol synthase transmembrane domain-containing protein n=1 Tax=Profundicola chukchiensis TaxID=2961959 RepID=UPI00243D5403|nr:lysylphosphatidylglycerol synthase transmembrane domain-containing protein [Profundicola chukchiensis]MDG4950499.1 flippase-like domain-containing protein [Profundicola chukchiensis]